MWGLYRSADLTAEQEKQVELFRSELQLQSEQAVLDVKRDYKDKLASKEDDLADLKRKLAHFEKLKHTVDGTLEHEAKLDDRERKLDARERAIESRTKAVDDREAALNKMQKSYEEDYKWHHDRVNDFQRDAADLKKAAADELKASESKSYEHGYATGHAAGIKQGLEARIGELGHVVEQFADLARMGQMVGALHGPVVVNGDKPVLENDASKALADAFAKHLTKTIDRVMDNDEDEEIE
jgi:chromosome segregation ATPase